MTTIKIDSYHDLWMRATEMVFNNEEDLSYTDVNNALPHQLGVQYTTALNKFMELQDSSQNISDPGTKGTIDSIAEETGKAIEKLTEVNCGILTSQLAMKMAKGEAFDGVKFKVSDEIRQQIQSDYAAMLAEQKAIDRNVNIGLTAMTYIMDGRSSSLREYYEMQNDDSFKHVDVDEAERKLNAELKTVFGENLPGYGTPEERELSTGKRDYMVATLRINMHTADDLNMDNYKNRIQKAGFDDDGNQVLNNTNVRDRQWCTDSVNYMFRTFYGNERYEQMVRDNADMLQGIYVDGEPASMLYQKEANYEFKCAALMRTVLDGGHQVNICPLEKKEDDKYYINSEKICPVNVLPSLEAEEEYSLWRAILRFFGIHVRTRAEKLEDNIKFSDLENQEAVEKIRLSNRQYKEYADSVQPIKESIGKYNQLYDNVRAYGFAPNLTDPNEYMSNAVKAYNFVEPSSDAPYGLEGYDVLITFDRGPSWRTMAIMYMMSEGLTIEQMLDPDDAVKERMKTLGKEFADTVKMPENPLTELQNKHPDYTKEQLIEELKKPELQAQYKSKYDAQTEKIAAMYDKVNAGYLTLESQRPKIDYSDLDSIAEGYVKASLFETASCDIVQTAQFLEKKSVHKDKLKPMIEYADGNQYKTAVAKIAKNMVRPEFTERGVFNQSTVYSMMATALAEKKIQLDIAAGIEKSPVYQAMVAMQAESETGLAPNGVPFASPMAFYQLTIHAQTPVLESQFADYCTPEMFNYAKDIISGKTPMPDDMFDVNGVHFFECYERHQQQNPPSLQKGMSRK